MLQISTNGSSNRNASSQILDDAYAYVENSTVALSTEEIELLLDTIAATFNASVKERSLKETANNTMVCQLISEIYPFNAESNLETLILLWRERLVSSVPRMLDVMAGRRNQHCTILYKRPQNSLISNICFTT